MNRNFENYDNSLYEMDMECMKEQQGGRFQEGNLHLQNTNQCFCGKEPEELNTLTNRCQSNGFVQEREERQFCKEEFKGGCNPCGGRERCQPICPPKKECACEKKQGNNSCILLLLLLCCCNK